MRWFRREPQPHPQPVVMVAYRDLTRTADSSDHGYAFVWPFANPQPQPGVRVVIPGSEGLTYGIVLRTATAADLQGLGSLKSIERLVTEQEYRDATAAYAAQQQRREQQYAEDQAEGWVSVLGVGDYQRTLGGGPLPRRVPAELLPWDRQENVTVRVSGQRVGDLPCGPTRAVYPALAARRAAGLPLLVVEGEVRRGDYVPAYLAVHVPTCGEALAAFIAQAAPPGWTPPRPAELNARLHKLGRYQDALAGLFAKYRDRTRGVEAVLAFDATPSGKYAGQTRGRWSVGGVVFAELNAPIEGDWADVLADYQAGTPGRTLVHFTRTAEGKYGAYGTYKTPKPTS